MIDALQALALFSLTHAQSVQYALLALNVWVADLLEGLDD